jgi:photosystem II stability/assembly factor-like uncharacterized protein
MIFKKISKLLVFLFFISTSNILGDTISPLTFRSIKIIDNKYGWVAGDKGVYYTRNGGVSWSKQSVNLGSISDYGPLTHPFMRFGMICWADQNKAIIEGSKGLYIVSVDNSFIMINDIEGIYYKLKVIAFWNVNEGWGGDAGGNIYYTSASGKKWIRKKYFSDEVVIGIKIISHKKVWFILVNGSVYSTTDAGISWVKSVFNDRFPAAFLISIQFPKKNVGWIGSMQGNLYRSADDGLHWINVAPPLTNRCILFDIIFLDDKVGWALGCKYVMPDGIDVVCLNENNHEIPCPNKQENKLYPDANLPDLPDNDYFILNTKDGGNSWTIQFSGLKSVPLQVQASKSGIIWVVNVDGTVLHSTDFGKNWRTLLFE